MTDFDSVDTEEQQPVTSNQQGGDDDPGKELARIAKLARDAKATPKPPVTTDTTDDAGSELDRIAELARKSKPPVPAIPQLDLAAQPSPFDTTAALAPAPTKPTAAAPPNESMLGRLKRQYIDEPAAQLAEQEKQNPFRQQPDLTEQLGAISQDKANHNALVRGTAGLGSFTVGAIQHPIKTAQTLIDMPIDAAKTVGQYMLEQANADQVAAEAQTDAVHRDQNIAPTLPIKRTVSDKDAAIATGQLLALGIAPELEEAVQGVLGGIVARRAAAGGATAGMGRGVAIASRAIAGAPVGAAFMPNDPLAGAVAGGLGGGLHATLSGESTPIPGIPNDAEGANLAGHPEKLLPNPNPRARTTATANVAPEAPSNAGDESPFTVETNTPAQAIDELHAQNGQSPGETILEQIKNRRAADRAANTDALTGLGNQGAWEKVRPTLEADPDTHIIRFDANGFKGVNDVAGHAAGDEALKAIAQAIHQNAPGLPSFRVGGDEFAVAVPKEHAAAVRDAIEQAVGVNDVDGARFSISGGIGNTSAEADANAIARKAQHKAEQGIPERGAAPVTSTSSVRSEPLKNIDLEPDRFQFKLDQNEKGVTGDLTGVKWNPDLAGIMNVWRDPADGRLKIINGHRRYALADANNVKNVDVREVQAPDAQTARTIGAMINIAEGHGTPVDAAKLFRDTQMSPADLEARGISLKGKIAKDGLALAKLHPALFADVASGKMPVERAAVIGRSGLASEQQLALKTMLDQREANGKRMTNEAVGELARFVQGAGSENVSQDSLFGAETMAKSLAPEKAELSAYIKERLSKDRRLFGFLTRGGRAEQIEGSGAGKIETDKATDLATRAAQTEELYNRLSMMSGPVADALNTAAKAIAQGADHNATRNALYQAVTEAIASESGSPPPERAGQGQRGERAPSSPAGNGPAVEPGGAAPPAPESQQQGLLEGLKQEVAKKPGEPLSDREKLALHSRETISIHGQSFERLRFTTPRGDVDAVVAPGDNGQIEIHYLGKPSDFDAIAGDYTAKQDAENYLGPVIVRAIIRQLAREFPGAKEAWGFRVGGARAAAGNMEGVASFDLNHTPTDDPGKELEAIANLARSENEKHAPVETDQESHYADETNGLELLKASTEEARALWQTKTQAQEILADAEKTVPTTPVAKVKHGKLLADLKTIIEHAQRDYNDKMSEIRDAFGDKIANDAALVAIGHKKIETLGAPPKFETKAADVIPRKEGGIEVAPHEQPSEEKPAPVVQRTIEEEGTAAAPHEIGALMGAARAAIARGDMPTTTVALRKWAAEILGRPYESRTWKMDDVYDAIEGAVNQLAAEELGPALQGDPLDLAKTRELEETYFKTRLRSSGMLARQQFSTPLPIARAAQFVAGVQATDKILEPTAGTGNLVNFLRNTGVNIDVNELEPRRAAVLRLLGLNPTSEDALRLPLNGKRYNVIITNPPYGAAQTGKYSGFAATPFVSNDVAQRFIAAAMQELAPGGWLVAVMPPNTLLPSSQAFREWLAKEHTPIAYIESPEGAYETRGTSIGTVLMIVAQGKHVGAPPAAPMIVRKPDWATWEKAVSAFGADGAWVRRSGYEAAEDVAPTKLESKGPKPQKTEASLIDRSQPESEIAQHGADTESHAEGSAGTPARAGGAPDQSGRTPEGSSVRPERPAPGSGTGVESGGGRHPELVAVNGPGNGVEGAAGTPAELVPGVPGGRVEPRAGDSPERRKEIEAANDSPVFTPYALGNLERRSPHPRLVVETRAMAGLPAPAITAKLQSELVNKAWGRSGAKGGISDEQMDAVMRVLSAWDRGHGFLAADDVGVGKTREGAALVLEAIKRGETRILYTTKNENNVSDAMAEFRLVASGTEDGAFPAQFVFVGDYKGVKDGKESLPAPKGPVVYFAHSYNFASYAEALAEVKPTTWIADEAHEYKNLFAARGMGWRGLHEQMLKAGGKFAYFTATPAVTVDELGYLYGLKEWVPGGFGDWVDRKLGKKSKGETDEESADENAEASGADIVAMGDRSEDTSNLHADDKRIAKSEKKGKFMRGKPDVFDAKVTPAETEQIMRELKGSGKYIARDLWRGGVKFDVVPVDLLGETPEAEAARQRYDTAAELARDISMAGRQYGAMNAKVKTTGLDRAMIQSYLKQLLFGLRLPTVLEHAKQALKAGQQVIISLHSVAGDADVEEGLSEQDASTPVNERLRSAINRINTSHVRKHGDGEQATYEDLGEIPEALMVRSNLMNRLEQLEPLIDPVRAIEQAFGAKNVAVITGKRTAKQRKLAMGEFQSGLRTVAVISKAGKVGISLHDVNGKQRRMLVSDYEWSADTFKQELGRVDRTGQKSSPYVSLVASNLAGEKKFAATIAARMASLGATSKGSAESTGTDALDQFDVSDGVSLAAMREAVRKLDPHDRSFFTGSKFNERVRVGHEQYEFVPKREPDKGAGIRDFLLEMMMFPIEASNHVWSSWVAEREALNSDEQMELNAARRTARAKGEVLRRTLLTAPGDPPLTMVELKNAAGEKHAVLQGFVTPYIAEIQQARGTSEGGFTKSRRYVHVTTPQGELVTGLDLTPYEARQVKAMFGKNERKTVTPAEAWIDLQTGDKVPVQGPDGAKWTLRPRRDGRFEIVGATLNKHRNELNGYAKFETVGNYLYVPHDEPAVLKFLERFPPAQPEAKGNGGHVAEERPSYGQRSPERDALTRARFRNAMEGTVRPTQEDVSRAWSAATSDGATQAADALEAVLENMQANRNSFESALFESPRWHSAAIQKWLDDTAEKDGETIQGTAREPKPIQDRFYSRLERAIAAAPFEKGTAEQWRAALSKNVAAGERQWTKVDALLERHAGATLTRAQIADVFDRNRIRLEESVASDRTSSFGARALANLQETRTRALLSSILGEMGVSPEGRIQAINAAEQDVLDSRRQNQTTTTAEDALNLIEHEHEGRLDEIPQALRDRFRVAYDKFVEAKHEALRYGPEAERSSPRYEEYTEPGGENYREFKIRLPASKIDEPFHQSHFPDDKNLIVHARTTDRTLPNGEHVLFIEELQSDWHQQGREKGYVRQVPAELAADLKETRDKLNNALERDDRLGFGRMTEARAAIVGHDDWADRWDPSPDTRALGNHYRELVAQQNQLLAGVPDAPMKKTEEWVGLALKRLIDEAVEGGYDRIAWTTGDQQTGRYDLSKHVDKIMYEPDLHQFRAYKNGHMVVHRVQTANELPELIGKSAAAALLASPRTKHDVPGETTVRGVRIPATVGGWHSLEGKDLIVGGHGMKAFYDAMLPAIVRDVGKQLGVKLQLEGVPATARGPWVVYDESRLEMGGPNDAVLERFETEGDAIDAQQKFYPDALVGEDRGGSHENPSFKITPELRAAVKEKGHYLMERAPKYNPKSIGGYTVTTDGGKPAPAHASPREEDVALTRGQRATLERVVDRVKRAGLPESGQRRRELESAAKLGLIDPIGRYMRDGREAAIIMSAFRHPAMEILHAFVLDKSGRVVGHMMRTSGMVNYVALPESFVDEVKALADAVGGVDVKLGHNHPSGDPTPSRDADFPYTDQFAKMAEERGLTFKGHVIINHDEASFFTIDRTRDEIHVERHKIPPAERLAKSPWRTAVEAERPKILTAEQGIWYLASVTNPDAATIAFLDAQNRIVAVRPYLLEALDTINNWLPQAITDHGGARVVIALPQHRAYDFADRVKRAQARTNPHLTSFDESGTWSQGVMDVLGIRHNVQGAPSESVSYAERGVIRELPSRIETNSSFPLEPGAPASEQLARARAGQPSGGRYGAAGAAGGVRNARRIGEEDLFGNSTESEPPQGSLFSPQEGTAAKRSLTQTERAAQSELEKLRAKERLTTSPVEKIKLAKRIAQLEKLLNRDQKIGASEMATRAVAQLSDDERTEIEDRAAYAKKRIAYYEQRAEKMGELSPGEEATLGRHRDELAALERKLNGRPEPPAEGNTGVTDLFGGFGEKVPEYNHRTGRYEDTSTDLREASGMGNLRSNFRPLELIRKIKAIFNPESLGPAAKGVAGTIRHEGALRFRAYTQAVHALRDLKKYIDKQPRRRQVELWDAYENGRPTGDQFVDAANAIFRRVTEERTDELIKLDRLRAESAIDNYIGRFWTLDNKAGKAESFLRSLFAKRPFEGPKSFLKQRSLEGFVDGLKAGLVPPTYNYVESQLAKIAEMERLIGAVHMLDKEKEAGRAKPVMLGRKPPVTPDGRAWVQIDREGNDPAFTVYGPRTGMVSLPSDALDADVNPDDVGVLGHRIIGRWYAHPDAAPVWQNHLSRGMRGNPIYDALTAPGQAATSLILGVSGFHGTVIATEGLFSELALAGEGGKGTGAALARGVVSPVSGVAFGRKVMQEYRSPGSHPELARVLEAMVAGGFREQEKSELWNGERTEKLKRAVRQALHADKTLMRAWGASKVPLDAIYAGVELAAAPLMSKYVPLMKDAATYHAVAQRLDELGPNVDPERLEREMWDIVKEMDLRFGQVNYDNHFINNVAKHLAQALFMAPGWTFGTLALAARGIRDVGVVPKRVYDRARGKPGANEQPILGRSGKYWVAAVVATMLLNGLITYFNTGETPGTGEDGYKDFFAFRDGSLDVNGNANRHTIPGYLMGDVYNWSHHPYKTFLNKLSPFFAFAGRFLRNETYYGDMVYDPDTTLGVQAKQTGKEAVKELGTPLSVQNYLEGRKREEGGASEMARSLLGIKPANRELVRTPAQNRMAELAARKGHTALTPEAAEARDERRGILLDMRTGTGDIDRITRAVEHGELTVPELTREMKRAGMLPLQESFKALTLPQAVEVFNIAKPREQLLLMASLNKKIKAKHKN